MKVFGSDMHVVTFIIMCIQILILFFQVIYYSARTSDKKRLYYLSLLALFVSYNLFGGLYPDPSKDYIPYKLQMALAYGSGFLLAAYFPYYLYKNFELKELRFHALYGIFIYLLLPFGLYLLIIYLFYFEADIANIIKYGIIIPGIYTFSMLYTSILSILKRYKREKKKEVLFFFAAILPWSSMPLLTYFSVQQLPEVIVMNSGFVVFSIIYLRNIVLEQRAEFADFNQIQAQSELKIEEQRKNLERKNLAQKTNFQQIIHEAKTPLTLLTSYLSEIDEENMDNFKIIQNSIQQLSMDINRLYEIERIGLDDFVKADSKEICNLSRVIIEFIKVIPPILKTKNLEIKQDIEEDIFVKSDLFSINRILFNIMDNAVRYSYQNGYILISLKKTEESTACLEFKDHGSGMSKAAKLNIFKPYNKVDNNSGLGLGMFLINQIIEHRLKGKITVESNPGIEKGTKIQITLPYLILEKGEVVSEGSDISLQDLHKVYNGQTKNPIVVEHKIKKGNKYSLLILEDNLALLSYYANKLADTGNNIYVAENAAKALDILKKTPIDLIISDINMNKLNGIEFFKIVKNIKSIANIPLIFITAINDKNVLKEVEKLQPLAIYQKPFDTNKLKNSISAILYYTKHSDSIKTKRFISVPENEIKQSESASTEDLSKRELEILSFLISDLSIQKIADELYISPRTVNTHQSNIYRKLDINSRIELMSRYKNVAEVDQENQTN